MGFTSPFHSHGHAYIGWNTQGYMSIHKYLYCYMLLPTLWDKGYKFTTTDPHSFLCTEFVPYWSLGEFVLVSDFNAQTSCHQGQDFHPGVNGFNMLEVSRPQCLRESEDHGHYNTFS